MIDVKINPPNGTSEDVILHAAIASWAGFLYQGICALCVVIEKLLTEDDAVNWYLNVEGYEDFAILDANKRILSFHQCKDYKSKQSWKGEFEKMEDKRYYWNQKGLCAADAPLYFHTNLNVDYSNGVVCYPYKNGNDVPNTVEIFNMLTDLIDKYCKKENFPVPVERVRNRLVAMIEQHVNFLYAMGKKVPKQTQQISIDNSISFDKIVNLIRSSEDERSLEDKVRLSVFYLNYFMTERLEDVSVAQSKRVIAFLDSVNNMDIKDKIHFVKCLFPDINIEIGRNAATEISNRSRVNYLFNVLTDIHDEIDLKQMHWLNEGLRQSPSAIGSDMPPERYCSMIAYNPTLPPELLRDFDWIVGCLDHSVDDILGNVKDIKRVNEVNYNDITKARKTGLLSIKDKNDGRIR